MAKKIEYLGVECPVCKSWYNTDPEFYVTYDHPATSDGFTVVDCQGRQWHL